MIWDLGYNGTSVNDIVKAAEVPKGSFYFYFESKEDFAVQALRAYFNEVHGEFSGKLLNGEGTPLQRIKEFYSSRMDMLINTMSDKRGCMACNLSSEVAEHIIGIRTEVARIHNKVLLELVAVGKQAQEKGEIAKDIEVEKMFAFIEDAAKGAMVSMKAVGDHGPIAILSIC